MIYAGQHEKYLDIAGYLSKLYTTFSKKRDFTEDISLQKKILCVKIPHFFPVFAIYANVHKKISCSIWDYFI
jgi:hypothetical protein